VTSLRQIEANRRNALRSTGPITEAGKHRSRRNAVRHGLCAETVVGTLEDIEDYKGFEAAIIADYDAETAVERELVLRLASLFWRIRRATAIETTLLGIQGEMVRNHRLAGRHQDLMSQFRGLRAFDHCNDCEASGEEDDVSLKASVLATRCSILRESFRFVSSALSISMATCSNGSAAMNRRSRAKSYRCCFCCDRHDGVKR
jgi:hypothetical protein